MAYLLGLPNAKGALVGSLLKDGPAEGAGIRMGDVIVRLGGTSVVGTSHLQRLVGWTPPGKDVAVEVMRDARMRKFMDQTGASARAGNDRYAGGEQRNR